MPLSDVQRKGDLRGIGRALADKGRKGDTMLAHINPMEAAILKSLGGSGTVNRATGLPQFYTSSPALHPYLKDNPDVYENEAFRADPRAHYEKYGKAEGRTWTDAPPETLPPGVSLPAGEPPPKAVAPWDSGQTDEQRYEEYLKPFRVTADEEPYAERYKKAYSYEDGRFSNYWDRNAGDYGNYALPPKRYEDWLLDDAYSWSEEPKPAVPYSSGEGEHLQKTDKDFGKGPAGWDAEKYLKNNPDLMTDPWAAANPLAHFALFGSKEGRGKVPGGYEKANYGQARQLYLENNPDVLAAGTAGQKAAAQYLKDNPDVAKDAIYKSDPYLHYQTKGKGEGRKWESTVGQDAAAKYLKDNPDVAKDAAYKSDPYLHYMQKGEAEGRKWEGTDSPIDPYEHYEMYGKNEGRKWIGEKPPTIKEKLQDFKFPAGMGLEAAKHFGDVKKALTKGYVEITPEIAGQRDPVYNSDETPWQPGEQVMTKYGYRKIGEKIPVDENGWVLETAEKGSMVPKGSHWNIITGKWVGPGEKVTSATKGRDAPEGSSMSNFYNFMSAVTQIGSSMATGPGGIYGALGRAAVKTATAAGTGKQAKYGSSY